MKPTLKPWIYGTIASATLTALYFAIVSAISGSAFAVSQFSAYWYFLLALAVGFGIQVGLYVYLRRLVAEGGAQMSGKAVAVTGTTSTVAMISCCAHYLANIVPILGIAGALSIVGQYQIEIFWVGLAFNLFGIAFIVRKIMAFKRHLNHE